ncbi:nuclear transport factor 2 family protein [Nocardia donostiensis]|uniref:SnoaL-like domain-containing protein n=1 Tax=Nocardia donostiensis TaxID=1538463 RepID=A0A1V2TF44_9NOCA|nr:nuclear transport factor 2 family protein [Nocardia donostiensis]ONM48125.1 hypothetical protein B0T46_14080 [Nocardia donostiensis]OQS13887.1 hypothetical protein B0T36_17305 [Nocardia donostiensis]OQS20354.1 hypothetical protein B0T44_10735 [Nocardia donostiensis]
MTSEPTTTELLTAVLASPRAVAAHDRAAWVGLFTDDAVVNDPVGASPHTGTAAIERFYDTFIAPNSIAFDVEHDFAGPGTILRDLAIEITMSTGATVRVPMHLRYELAGTDRGLRIAYLAAHWELPAMIARLLGTGPRGLGAGAKLGGLLIRNQGVGGLTGMARACTGVGGRGKRVAGALFAAASAGNTGAVTQLLGGRGIELVPGGSVPVEEFVGRARGLRQGKTIAAGRTVTASIEFEQGPAVAVIDFAPDAIRVETFRVFAETVAVPPE